MWTKGVNKKHIMEIWTAIIVISAMFPLYIMYTLIALSGVTKISKIMFKLNEKLYDIFFYAGEKLMFHAYYKKDFEKVRESLIKGLK